MPISRVPPLKCTSVAGDENDPPVNAFVMIVGDVNDPVNEPVSTLPSDNTIVTPAAVTVAVVPVGAGGVGGVGGGTGGGGDGTDAYSNAPTVLTVLTD